MYVLAACQAALIGVFGASALGKVRGRASWSAFVGLVGSLRLVPQRLVVPVAAGVAAGEVAVVMLLAVPLLVPAGLLLGGGLLGVFTASIVVTLRRRISAACRCFGPVSSLPLGRRQVVRNGLLIAVAVLAGLSWPLAGDAPHAVGLVVAAAGGLVAAVVLVWFDEIVELFTGPSVEAGLREQRRA